MLRRSSLACQRLRAAAAAGSPAPPGRKFELMTFDMKRLLFSLLLPVALYAQQPSAFNSPLDSTQLDPAAFTERVDGADHPVEQKEGPAWVVMTANAKVHPGHSGIKFGVSTNAGSRYLRIGWNAPVPCGAVLVRGGGALSVLRDGAAYPGKLDDETQWLPAVRLTSWAPSVMRKSAPKISPSGFCRPARRRGPCVSPTLRNPRTRNTPAGWVASRCWQNVLRTLRPRRSLRRVRTRAPPIV